MLGGLVGFADTNLLGHTGNEVGAFALVGMGAVFAGVIRAPITSILIIFEMTGSYGLILPLMIANMTSYAVAVVAFVRRRSTKRLLEQDNIFLPHPSRSAKHALEQISVAEAMRDDVVVLTEHMSVAEAADLVAAHELTTFPILNDQLQCVGVVTEMRLRRSLSRGVGICQHHHGRRPASYGISGPLAKPCRDADEQSIRSSARRHRTRRGPAFRRDHHDDRYYQGAGGGDRRGRGRLSVADGDIHSTLAG